MMDIMQMMLSKAGPDSPFGQFYSRMYGGNGPQMPYSGALSGMRHPQQPQPPMPQAQPQRPAYAPPQLMQGRTAPGVNWRQMMSKSYPMGFGG